MALPAKKQFQFWGIGALVFVLLKIRAPGWIKRRIGGKISSAPKRPTISPLFEGDNCYCINHSSSYVITSASLYDDFD